MGCFFGFPITKTSGGGGGGGGGLPGRYTYASAAGQVNNVTPATPAGWPGMQSARLIVTLPSGVANWTGLAAGNDGQEILLVNTDTANNLTLNNLNAGSLAANQFLCPNNFDLILSPTTSILLTYDGTLALWILTP
jgi:hypothetical protein